MPIIPGSTYTQLNANMITVFGSIYAAIPLQALFTEIGTKFESALNSTERKTPVSPSGTPPPVPTVFNVELYTDLKNVLEKEVFNNSPAFIFDETDPNNFFIKFLRDVIVAALTTAYNDALSAQTALPTMEIYKVPYTTSDIFSFSLPEVFSTYEDGEGNVYSHIKTILDAIADNLNNYFAINGGVTP